MSYIKIHFCLMLDMFLFSIKINEEDQVFSYSANPPLSMYVFLCFFLFPFPLWNTQKAKNGKKKKICINKECISCLSLLLWFLNKIQGMYVGFNAMLFKTLVRSTLRITDLSLETTADCSELCRSVVGIARSCLSS